jgi:CheY-like chemotaxis protein
MNTLDFTEKATILVVDDTADNLTLMGNVLKKIYKVKIANRGEKGNFSLPTGSRCPNQIRQRRNGVSAQQPILKIMPKRNLVL